MTTTTTTDTMATRPHDDRPVTLINTFYPKPGKLDEFLALQVEESRTLGAEAHRHGWRGNRIHRSRDDERVIIVTVFASAAAKRRWAESASFAEHLQRLAPLLERVDSCECDLVAENGML